MKFKLQYVHYMPKELSPGILYVSEEYGTAAHLCACGCGAKIRTPLGPTEWSLEETETGPTLWPSVGNWQQACQSHYWISKGEIIWSEQWTPRQIAAGRKAEEKRRVAYYEKINRQSNNIWIRFWHWLTNIIKP